MSIGTGGTVNSLDANVGHSALGNVQVKNPGSYWTVTGDLTLGGGDPGVIGEGGLVINAGGVVNSHSSRLGASEESVGFATVTGTGSTWTNNGYLLVGEHGTGTLIIKGGGAVTTGGNAPIGRDSGGAGTATVTGLGSTWTTNGFLRIGDLTGSRGSLTIADQGTVISNSQGRLANAHGTQGTALVTGAGSKWTGPATRFHVGIADEGRLTIADRGEVQSDFTTVSYTCSTTSPETTLRFPGIPQAMDTQYSRMNASGE